ncbi:lipopolysaccharide assembly protein LapA domain-containing protein [Planococcus shenhongbingii]|uniref:Lipopolysaccharide assembly protein LapA domain-containing protein n=1 Tax=Planococcus shenhongbingii TaxID=3058398 RepID=A0ABT8NED3_9BACL|nr:MULTISPECIES: lipopolysaccharide assembly protein LapA domain-containing protein [unclassified Planococcus (in: firmicutes)]MDN7245855.1 lipopolysaccharide assembly protein LapA domain-containing protein [Planococcus sp. N017]WKA60034.1 lipopolysaccharide assembly protein LapA domain-containing protein [Planococcus sp. N016]
MNYRGFAILSLIFAVIIIVFAVANIDPVPVNYLFGEAQWPLILVILGSALLGFLISALLSAWQKVARKKSKS